MGLIIKGEHNIISKKEMANNYRTHKKKFVKK